MAIMCEIKLKIHKKQIGNRQLPYISQLFFLFFLQISTDVKCMGKCICTKVIYSVFSNFKEGNVFYIMLIYAVS
jgi:hypothetical protein